MSFIVRNKYFICLFLFVIFSLLGQYGCATKVSLEFLFGEGWWIPLCVITVVPLIDVSRSFTQHYGEKSNIELKYNLSIMMVTSLIVSLAFVIQGLLPESICIANFLAVNIGGTIDLLVFWLIGSISQRPYFRMAFSNLAATMTGGAVFSVIAYTNFLTNLALKLHINYENKLLMDELFKGWITQTGFIWGASIIISIPIGILLEKVEEPSSSCNILS